MSHVTLLNSLFFHTSISIGCSLMALYTYTLVQLGLCENGLVRHARVLGGVEEGRRSVTQVA